MWLRPKRTKEKTAPPKGVIWIAAAVVEHTIDVLRSSRGPGGSHEGVAYWAGTRAGDNVFVTTCIAPAARTTKGSFATSSRTNAQVIMYLASANLELIGQVHSHPGSFVGHSDGDDERALMPYDGFLSIIVPDYARHGMLPLTCCGVHVFEKSHFRRLQPTEIEARFRVAPELRDLRRR